MSILSREKDTIIPELLYTLDRDHLKNFITVFGGKTLYIPTPTEFYFSMNCALAAYYFKCQDQRWGWIKKTLNLSDKELFEIKEKVLDWSKTAPKEEVNILRELKELNGEI